MSSTVATNSPTPNTNQTTTSSALTIQNAQQQDNGEPPFLAVGTEVSAKYKGAFCEATIQKVERLVKCRVTFKNNLGTALVIDDNIRGTLRVGATIEAKHPDKNCYLEAIISKIIDASQYTVIFDDGDITTLRRTSLCLKSGKHFAESESLDHLPLTNPEHFGNPVSLNARGNRRRRRRSAYSTATVFSSSTAQFSDNDDNDSIEGSNTSVDDEDSSSILTHQSSSTTSNFKLNSNNSPSSNHYKDRSNLTHHPQDLGMVVCVNRQGEYGDKRIAKFKDLWFPGLVVSPNAQADSNTKLTIDPLQDHLVKSFSNGRFYQLKRKDTKEFTKELGNQILNDNCSSTSIKSAIEKALTYLDKNELPSSWDYETLIGSNSSPVNDNGAEDDQEESSDDLESLIEDEDDDLDDAKSVEEKDRFVAQLYKYMDERGTPINKTPTIWGDDLDLYNLYRLVIKMGGYNRVCNKNAWKAIYNKLNLPNNEVATQANANQLRLAYKKYLLNFVDFFRKLGCTMVDTCIYSSRGSSTRTARCERNWRTLSESTKLQQDTSTKAPEKSSRRKKSITHDLTMTNDKKEDDEKKTHTLDKTATIATPSPMRKARKNGRKKFKLDGDDSNVNGNEPEEKYIPNDSDFESDNDYNFNTPTISKDVAVNVGDRIRVKYGKGKQLKVYEAKVMKEIEKEGDIDLQKVLYFVHYTGWNTRYDEWIKRNRIVEVVGDSNKSPKRRGGKSKNKGVPLTPAEDQGHVSAMKSEFVKSETTTSVSIPGKRGRPPSAVSIRNRDKSPLSSITTETTSSPANKSKTEISTTTNTNNSTSSNKKIINTSPPKRSRQRSECVETDIDEQEPADEDSKIDPKQTDIKKESVSTNYDEEVDAENDDDSSSEIAKEQQATVSYKRGGYKKLRRSDSIRKEEKSFISSAVESIQSNSESQSKTREIQASSKAILEDDLPSRRRQRKTKKNEKLADQPSKTTASKDEDVSKQEIVQPIVSPAAAKKRKLLQQNVSSDEDDSSTSSTGQLIGQNNLNTFSKRKRISNSKYRQDNALSSSKTTVVSSSSCTIAESTSSSTTSLASSVKESDSTKKRAKEEKEIKLEKTIAIEEIATKTSKPQSGPECSVDVEESEPTANSETIKSSASSSEAYNTFLLCKEVIELASSSCDEGTPQHVQSKNSNLSTFESNVDHKESTQVVTNAILPAPVQSSSETSKKNLTSAESKTDTCSTAVISSSHTDDTSSKMQSASNSSSKTSTCSSNEIVHTVHNKNSVKDNDSKNDESEYVDSHQQFTPPTTPESPKSNSSSHNDKDSNDESKATCDKDEINSIPTLSSSSQNIETHGLDMIAFASGVSKHVDIDRSNKPKESKKEDVVDALTMSNSFSPRKKRRGRGRTSSQSESHSSNYHSNVATNLFNTSSNYSSNNNSSSKDKDNLTKERLKGCKTRGSLGRKVKQNIVSNLDCMSEGTSHSDNFEPTSPASMLLNCISLESYNPTSKYNFCTPLDENLEAERRIQILHERMQELRKTYLNIKSELASIERRRKKFKRKERSIPSSPGSQTEHMNKTNSPQSTSSSSSASPHKDHQQSNLQHTTFAENNNHLVDNINHESSDQQSLRNLVTTQCKSSDSASIKEIC